MQRSQAETVGVHHAYHGSVFTVYTDFHNACRYKHVVFARIECRHNLFFRFIPHPAIHKPYRKIGKHSVLKIFVYAFCRTHLKPFAVFDERTDYISLLTVHAMFFYKTEHSLFLFGRNHVSLRIFLKSLSALYRADVYVSVFPQRKHARDRGRTHYRDVDRKSLVFEKTFLLYAELVQLVYNDISQIGKFDLIAYHRMCAYNDIYAAFLNINI